MFGEFTNRIPRNTVVVKYDQVRGTRARIKTALPPESLCAGIRVFPIECLYVPTPGKNTAKEPKGLDVEIHPATDIKTGYNTSEPQPTLTSASSIQHSTSTSESTGDGNRSGDKESDRAK